MYVQSDFMQEQQERRKEKGSLAPWLIGGGLLTAGGIGLALASKGKAQPNAELVKKGADDAKQLLNKQTTQAIKDMKARHKTVVKSDATGYKGLRPEDRKLVLQSRKDILNQSGLEKLEKSSDLLDITRVHNNILSTERNRDRINNTIKRVGTRNYMKYTTTANFAMAGALGGIKTGILNRVTGQLGNTVNKAKNWLQKTQQAKQQMGSATQAKQRLMPRVSPNAQAEAIARRKYGSAGVEVAPSLQSTIGKRTSELDKSLRLQQNAAIRTNLTAGSGRQINRGSSDRFSKSGSQATVNDNRTLRLKYTKDPRTGKLVSAAYNKLSLLCDL